MFVVVSDKPVLSCDRTFATTTSIVVNWTVSDDGGDDIVQYNVTLSKDQQFTQIVYSRNLFVFNNTDLSEKGGTFTIPGLSNGAMYYTEVAAKNCVGESVSVTQSCSTHCDSCICKQLCIVYVNYWFLSYVILLYKVHFRNHKQPKEYLHLMTQ